LQDVAVLGDMVLVSGFHDPSGAYGPDVHPRLWLADSITAGS